MVLFYFFLVNKWNAGLTHKLGQLINICKNFKNITSATCQLLSKVDAYKKLKKDKKIFMSITALVL